MEQDHQETNSQLQQLIKHWMRFFGRSSYTQYDPLHCSTTAPGELKYINDKKSYWFHLAPQTPQSGSHQRHIPGTPATCEQWLKQIACCITPPSMQRPTLPAEADYQEPQSDDESENGDVPDLRGDHNFWLIGCEGLDKDLIRKWNLWLII